MLKPIAQPLCVRALHACRRLQEQLLDWLCDPAVGQADVTQANLVPPRVPTQIEAEWLWSFLQREDGRRPLVERAQRLAAMSIAEKVALRSWRQEVSALARQFLPDPPPWPQTRPTISAEAWCALQELMEAFYEKGLRSGLPYAADGSPVTAGGVTRSQFVQAFRDLHRLTPNPDVREVCVLCGGPLGQTPEVDHWVSKGKYPLLSVCANNLIPICGECNSTTNKGEKPVYSNGAGSAFEDWFHPYLRPANGAIRLDYALGTMAISAEPDAPADAPKVGNLDKLLNLAARWTTEFKAEYAAQQETLRRRIQNGRLARTQHDLQQYIEGEQADLVPTEPHHEVHRVLYSAMLDQARLAAWQTELGLPS